MPHFIKKILFVIVVLAGSTVATAQKRSWYVNNKLVDSTDAPLVAHFSPLYDTVIVCNGLSNWGGKRNFKLFAISNNCYYKINGFVGLATRGHWYPDSIVIIQSRQCDSVEGESFLVMLEKGHIFNLPTYNEQPCERYDSTGKLIGRYGVIDGGYDQFHFFDRHTYRAVSYYATNYYFDKCPSKELTNAKWLLDVFKNNWQTPKISISLAK